ncbi:hypothetical protein GUJ93_ZPchr0009g1584 [Zizania palustris]|uniref:Uncharacterized protein n=1 Tax=Zizania palustris TaxID=103762 RepID=A0A8J5RKU2_ZIZPA|nr:hypothetical protein GUJ93_ZPchr0009g1584 [Zizania palustris]
MGGARGGVERASPRRTSRTPSPSKSTSADLEAQALVEGSWSSTMLDKRLKGCDILLLAFLFSNASGSLLEDPIHVGAAVSESTPRFPSNYDGK